MTDASAKAGAQPRKRRLSKRALRFWAWFAAAVAFVSPWAVLGISPKPVATAAEQARPVVIVRKITRRVVIKDQPKPQPTRVVYVGGGSSTSSSGGGSTTSSGGSHP